MKRLLTLIAAVLLAVTGLYAQNANRNGFFIELQGGAAFGEVLKYEPSSYSNYPSAISATCLKGGGVGSLDFGYRFATSSNFAVDFKLGAWSDFAEVGKTLQLRGLPGIRWTTDDFGSNMSAYIALNAGVGLSPEGGGSGDLGLYVPIELSVGLNFSRHFYGGLIFNYSTLVSGEISDNGYLDIEGNTSYDDNLVHIFRQSYPSIGLRLGYRF